MQEKSKDLTAICEDILQDYIGGEDNFDAFLECQENAWKNGCFPETLEKKDLPPEVLKQIKVKSVKQVYQKEVFIGKNNGINQYRNFRK